MVREDHLCGAKRVMVPVFSRSLQEAISFSSWFHLVLPYLSSWQPQARQSVCELLVLILHNLAPHTDIAAKVYDQPMLGVSGTELKTTDIYVSSTGYVCGRWAWVVTDDIYILEGIFRLLNRRLRFYNPWGVWTEEQVSEHVGLQGWPGISSCDGKTHGFENAGTDRRTMPRVKRVSFDGNSSWCGDHSLESPPSVLQLPLSVCYWRFRQLIFHVICKIGVSNPRAVCQLVASFSGNS